MHSILQDLRFALRQFRHTPGFAITTILTLALGIGSAAAVFSVIDATLLRPLPYANQDRIVSPDTRSIIGWHQPWSLPSYLDARPQLSTLCGVFANCFSAAMHTVVIGMVRPLPFLVSSSRIWRRSK